MSEASEALWIRRLFEVGRGIVCELDQDALLERVLVTARELTDARYAALGILDEGRTQLAQFLTSGVAEDERHAIGDLPRGRGVLGVLIEDPRPLRLADVASHPSSYGCPLGHPAMRTFLGVPILVRGRAWGNLYLAEKRRGEFSERDEQAAVILAESAAVAIDNAQTFQTIERRRRELDETLRATTFQRATTVGVRPRAHRI
jgi:GAF domain-containing protein